MELYTGEFWLLKCKGLLHVPARRRNTDVSRSFSRVINAMQQGITSRGIPRVRQEGFSGLPSIIAE